MKLGDRKVYVVNGIDSILGSPSTTMDITTIHIEGVPGSLPISREAQYEWVTEERGTKLFANKASTVRFLNFALRHYQYVEFEEIWIKDKEIQRTSFPSVAN